MSGQRLRLRAVLVIVAICTLCISDNVGPRFLPLPYFAHDEAKSWQQTWHLNGSESSPSESDSFRVPMISQTQRRAQEKPNSDFLISPTAVFANSAQIQAHVEIHPHVIFGSSTVSHPQGRAPPRLL
jgi:hypothetical protein